LAQTVLGIENLLTRDASANLGPGHAHRGLDHDVLHQPSVGHGREEGQPRKGGGDEKRAR